MARSVDELVELFKELIELTILDEGSPQSFRVRAYENATDEIKSYEGDLSTLTVSALTKLDGVGKSTAQKIREFYDEGTMSKVETLRKKYPKEFVELGRIPGLGPKTLLRLRDELEVHNLETLKAAIDSKKIRELSGMGAKSEEKLGAALKRMGAKQNRRPIAEVLPVAEALVAKLKKLDGVKEALFCGSLRRKRDTIADVDIVVASESEQSKAIMDFSYTLRMWPLY